MTLDRICLLGSVVAYLAGIPLFWGRAVAMLATSEEVRSEAAPDWLIKGAIRGVAGVVALFWFAFTTLELAEIIWRRRPGRG